MWKSYPHSYVSTDFTYMSAYQLLKNSISISTSNARETYEIYGKSIPKSQIQLRVPQNLKAEFAIPQNLTEIMISSGTIPGILFMEKRAADF